ncbi:unnamed protein product, partial [Nesidiocoris tenuis]
MGFKPCVKQFPGCLIEAFPLKAFSSQGDNSFTDEASGISSSPPQLLQSFGAMSTGPEGRRFEDEVEEGQ